jgi:hypothetical protein
MITLVLRQLLWLIIVASLLRPVPLAAFEADKNADSGAQTATAKSTTEASLPAAGKGGPVIRTFGDKGGVITEVTSETKGTLSEENQREVAVLTAQIFLHIDEGRQAVDADDLAAAKSEVEKARKALQAVRALLPTTTVHTKTTAPDGNAIYEDERETQEDRVPLFEGMLSSQTLAPIVAAKRAVADDANSEADEVEGVRLVRSETVTTEVMADLNVVEVQLARAAKALQDNKPENATEALASAQVRGVEFRFKKEDTPLAEARDAMWLAKRSLEENNAAQAQANLRVARQALRLYREVASKERQQDVDNMLKEVDQLEGKLGKETAQKPATQSERTQQGQATTHWWERINDWFRRR